MQLRINRLTHAGALLLASGATLLATAGSASAASYTVSTTADGGAGSLRAAIVAADAAGGSSTITVPAGAYALTIPSTDSTAGVVTDDPATGDLDVDNDASVTIVGAGAGQTIIDPQRNDRAFAVHPGASLSISGVTIQHGESDGAGTDVKSISAGNGGAIYNDGSLTISDSKLVHDSAYDFGGAIYSDTAATSTAITNSTVSSDSADDPGGAVYVEGGDLTLSGDTFTNDSAAGGGGAVYYLALGTVTIGSSSFADDNGGYDGGGALYLEDATAVAISNSTFSDNTAQSDGGAIYLDSTGSTTVSGSTFTDDDSSNNAYGGAIYASTAEIAVSNSAFNGDTAYYGGAIYIDGAAAAGRGDVPNETITNSSFTGDIAYYGGAVYDAYGWVSLTNSTLAQNGAYEGGGFFYDSGDGATLTNDTVVQNTSNAYGAGIYMDTSSSSGDPVVLNHDTIADNSDAYGGAVYLPSSANTIENTIIADNTAQSRESGADCTNGADYNESSSYTDAGNNLDSDGSCFSGDAAVGATGDVVGVDPLLAALANNGGPVETMALQAGSPAIGAGSGCTGSDARGISLPSTCDIGAFQTAATDLSVAGSGTASVLVGQPVSYTFTVTNNGPGDDAGVTLTDSLPAGADFFGASSSQGSCSGNAAITCDLGALDSSASATVTIEVVPTVTGTLANAASVAGAFTDPVSSNDRSTVSTTVAAIPTATAAAPPSTPATPAAPALLRPATNGSTAYGIGARKATLRAFVDSSNEKATWWFQYGTTRHFGKITARHSLPAGIAVRRATVRITHLKPHKTYYFRIVVKSAAGEIHGLTMKFKTR